MGKEQIVVGLEIGTSKVCAVVGDIKADGTVKILGVGEAPSRGVRKGEIVDFETAGKCVREALVDAEEKSDVMIGSVYLSVTGAHITSFNNRGAVTIPEDREEIDDHPHNGWSLFGLQQALAAQAKRVPEIDADFDQSWARSDVWIRSSRF